MQIKVTKSGPRRYIQVVRSVWDAAAGRPRQEYIATLGRLDQLKDSDIDTLVNGLLRVGDRPTLKDIEKGISSETTAFEPALTLGDVWTVMRIWSQLGLTKIISQKARRTRHQIPLEQLVRVMVVNRLSDPMSKLGILRWLETVCLPGIATEQVTHQRLLRAMDFLMEHKDAIEEALTRTLLPLFDTEMDVVFYDITTVRVHGETEFEGDIREYGKSKAHSGTDRQFAVGVVQTADGFPVTHEVFEGAVGETTTVKAVVHRLCERFPIRRLIFVADRAMVSAGNLEVLESVELPDGKRTQYIIAVPARTFREMTQDLGELHLELVAESRVTGKESVRESEVDGRRVVMAHCPEIAARSRRMRARKLVKVLRLARKLANRLNAQEDGNRSPGRPLTDDGAKITFHEALAKHRLTRLIEIHLDDEVFSWDWKLDELKRDLMLDGKLVIVSNVPKSDMSSEELIRRYKDLADIERGFRVLKSQIEIAPVHHRLPDRIRAHTMICFLALVIQRVMRHRLRKHKVEMSPEAALYRLRTIQRHSVKVGTGKQLTGISTIALDQRGLFDALEVAPPTRKHIETAK
ncbi:MAG: IS1634 family transposase [Thermoanaerobaculales bacterium]|nr:IS1634 family transposase [Thermoanaerobaculales bacterium]